MSRRRVLRGACALALLGVLSACAPVRLRGDQAMLAAQAAREAALSTQDHWSIEGKLGVSDGHDGGSGQLSWRQDGAVCDFVLRAPVTGRSFRLHADADGAVLEGLDQGRLRGADAEVLLRQALGWEVPIAELRAWVRGLRADGAAARIAFNADGLPARIEQDGWTVDYRDWYTDRSPPLPRKVYAERAPYRVRLLIQSWSPP